MTLLLRNAEIQGLMEFGQYIQAVEEGYRQIGLGQGSNFPRHNVWIPGDPSESVGGGHLRPHSRGSLKFKAALLPGLGGAGVQAYTAGLKSGLQTFLFLFDTDTGELSAIMEVLYYDWLKTGAVGAVATQYLAPEDARTAGLIGAGRHARTQLRGLCAVRPIERVQVFSRRPEPRREFCSRMAAELGIPVVPVNSPAEAIRGADIITTITTSAEPVFAGELLADRPVHINAMGAHYPWAREIDDHVITRSRIVLDEWEQGLGEHGEILIPLEKGIIEESDIYADLGQIVAGQLPGREPEAPITLFLSGGTGIEDVAVATRLLELARAKGVGTEFDFNHPYSFEL